MSYANGTTHYNLPQTVGTDKRDWSDGNQAFQDVDAALYQATQDTAQAALDIDALEGRMDTAEQGISTNAGNIAGLDTRLTTAEGAIATQAGQIADVRQDTEDMICAFNEASATSTHAYAIGDYFIYNDVLYRAIQVIAIGDTIVPDTNCTTTNVTTEVHSLSATVDTISTDVNTLKSNVAVVDFTAPTTINTATYGAYPDGFNKNNCALIFGGSYHSNSWIIETGEYLGLSLTDGGVQCYAIQAGRLGDPVRGVLLKLPQ